MGCHLHKPARLKSIRMPLENLNAVASLLVDKALSRSLAMLCSLFVSVAAAEHILQLDYCIHLKPWQTELQGAQWLLVFIIRSSSLSTISSGDPSSTAHTSLELSLAMVCRQLDTIQGQRPTDKLRHENNSASQIVQAPIPLHQATNQAKCCLPADEQSIAINGWF